MSSTSWQMNVPQGLPPPPPGQVNMQSYPQPQNQESASHRTHHGTPSPSQQYDRQNSSDHQRAPMPPFQPHPFSGQYLRPSNAPPNQYPPLPPPGATQGVRFSAPPPPPPQNQAPSMPMPPPKPGGGQHFPPYPPPSFSSGNQQYGGSGLQSSPLPGPPQVFPPNTMQPSPAPEFPFPSPCEGQLGMRYPPAHETRFNSSVPPHGPNHSGTWSTEAALGSQHQNHQWSNKSQPPADRRPSNWRDKQNKSNITPSRIQPYQSRRQPGRSTHDLSMSLGQTGIDHEDSKNDMPSSVSEPEREESEDQKWVNNWLQGIKKKEAPPKERRKHLVKLSDARSMLTTFLHVLNQLKEKQKEASDVSVKEIDETKWAQLCREMEDLSTKLSRIETTICNPDFVEGLKVQVEKRRRKRERKRRCRQEEWEMREEEIQGQNERVDASMAAALQAAQEKEQEEVLQKEVDGVMSEVRRKKVDVNKTMELLRALRKLRNLRKETAKRKGNLVPVELDVQFEERISNLEEMMNKQKLLYVEEERALQVMLEEEHEETREKVRQKKQQKEQQKAQKEWQQRLELLFGKAEELQLGHPLFMFRQFHLQAEHSLQSLINIRRLWDSFVALETDPAASSIPVPWVTPPEPANQIWATALEGSSGS